MNLEVQILWQAALGEPLSADIVAGAAIVNVVWQTMAGAAFLWISRPLKRALDIFGFEDLCTLSAPQNLSRSWISASIFSRPSTSSRI